MGPVMLVADGDLQENAGQGPFEAAHSEADADEAAGRRSGAVAEVAKLLVAAENPVIMAGRVARTPEGMKLMVELAETLQAPVQGGGRNMPNRHPLSGGGSVGNADVILGLQVDDLWGTLNNFRDQQERSYRSIIKPGGEGPQHLRKRSLHEEQLSGLPALRRSGHRDCSRCAKRRCRH